MSDPSRARHAQNKVPEVSPFFWVIKVLCTTVGETVADFLSDSLGLGLTNTTLLMTALLGLALLFQFKAKQYEAPLYWATVAVISIVGTLVTDNLTDTVGVPLGISTGLFAVALAATFAIWQVSERTLSIRVIVTRRREVLYWLAVLVTFALGTALGDLAAERLELGYATASGIFAALVAVIAIAHLVFKLGAVASFWIAYILTRPLGAAVGDYLSHTSNDGGLGLGTFATSELFLGVIAALVAYLAVTKRDVLEAREHPTDR